MFRDIFHSSLVKGEVSGPGIIGEALNPALCPFWKQEPRLVQPGDMRIKHMNCEMIWAYDPTWGRTTAPTLTDEHMWSFSGAAIIVEMRNQSRTNLRQHFSKLRGTNTYCWVGIKHAWYERPVHGIIKRLFNNCVRPYLGFGNPLMITSVVPLLHCWQDIKKLQCLSRENLENLLHFSTLLVIIRQYGQKCDHDNTFHISQYR